MIQKYDNVVIPSFLFIKNTVVLRRISGGNRGELIRSVNIYSKDIDKGFFPHKIEMNQFYSRNFIEEIIKIVPLNQFIIEKIKQKRLSFKEIYFEKQQEALCGLHALNNALQYKLFTKSELTYNAQQLEIQEKQLYYNKEMENIYYDDVGNFNTDVLELSLRKKSFSLTRFRETSLFSNMPVGMYIICNGFHWFAIRKFIEEGPMWNLDSLLEEATIFESAGLKKVLNETRDNIFIINFI